MARTEKKARQSWIPVGRWHTLRRILQLVSRWTKQRSRTRAVHRDDGVWDIQVEEVEWCKMWYRGLPTNNSLWKALKRGWMNQFESSCRCACLFSEHCSKLFFFEKREKTASAAVVQCNMLLKLLSVVIFENCCWQTNRALWKKRLTLISFLSSIYVTYVPKNENH